MPTPLQIKLIHVAKKQAGLNDTQYRTLLKNVAGVASCKDLDEAGFEDVMAVMEDLGFVDRKHGGEYWRGRVTQRGMLCSTRMVHKIAALARDCRYEIPPLCLRFSERRTDQVGMLHPREAWNLIEMLKAVIEREEDAEIYAAEIAFSPPPAEGEEELPF